jgi:outer membrane lipoprotein SlyB
MLTSASLAGAVLGGISSAVIGGLFGFLAASFIEIIRTSLREAIAAERSSVTADR